jgi:hypothetical protein
MTNDEATAGLAAWNTHLHRRLGQMNGNGAVSSANSPPIPPDS